MSNGLTRTFNAIYTSRDNKEHKLKVRIYKRLGMFGLSIGLIRSDKTFSLGQEEGNHKKENRLDGQDLTKDLELIEGIIEKRSSKGQSLEVRDNRISMLESYFYDYLLNSFAADIAKKPDKSNKEQSNFYKSVLFGTPKNSKEVDNNSIYGSYVENYLKYHEKQEHTEEEKDSYITALTKLEERTNADLNLGGSINVVVPYSDYSTYLEKKTTKQQENKHESFN